jgi:serine/threonine protein kinase
MTHLNSDGINELHLNCFAVFGTVFSARTVPVPYIGTPMNVINLLTFLSGSVFGDRSSIWESSQLAAFGDEIPLDKLYGVVRRFLNWIVVGSEMDLTKSPLATLSPGCIRLFAGGTGDNRSDMSRLAFDFLEDLLPPPSRELSEVLMVREHLFLCPQVGNSHSGFDPVRGVRIDQSSKRYAGKYFSYAEGSEGKLRDYHSLMLYLSGLTHSCLVPIIKFCDPEVGHGPVVVNPFDPNGCLSSFVSSHAPSATERALLVGELACGLGFLHSEQMVHESLRPSKLLIDDESHLHISGFATNQLIRSGILNSERDSDVTYTAPECSASDGDCSDFNVRSKCDIYSFGLVLCELFFGFVFTAQDPPSTFLGDDPNSFRQFPPGLNLELCNLILRCCSGHPAERPTISEVLTVLSRHRFRFTQEVDCDSVMAALADLDVTCCIGAHLSRPLPDCEFVDEPNAAEPRKSEGLDGTISSTQAVVVPPSPVPVLPTAADLETDIAKLEKVDPLEVRDLESDEYGTSRQIRVQLAGKPADFVAKIQSPERPAIPTVTHREFAQLIEQCWDSDPTKRPSIGEVWHILKSLGFVILEGVDSKYIEDRVSQWDPPS